MAPTIRSRRRRSNPIAIVAKRRVCLLSLLSALLLFAQHVALTHAIWHQSNAKARSATLVERHSPPSESRQANPLCDFDAMLGQLLAGGAAASCAAVLAAEGTQPLISEASRLAALAPIQPRSRGPPLVL